MKNNDTWTFAHRHCGKTWKTGGAVLLALTAVANVFFFRLDETGALRLYSVICFVQMVFLIASVFYTERALKKHFDENGNRRE